MHAFRFLPVVFVQRSVPQATPTEITQKVDIVRDHLSVEPLDLVAYYILPPCDFLFYSFTHHLFIHFHLVRRKQFRFFLLQLQNDVAK